MTPPLPYVDAINTSVSILLFLIGLTCLVTQRNAIKQIIGIKIMLQGVTLALVHAGTLLQDSDLAQTLVVSALIVETVVISIGVALVINIFRSVPSGDVDRLDRLKG
ncbi:MAG: hypothetical protein GX620_04925 [Chloroflexi bacterium]|nr:hypothetical protein [Chloroflexota bacterium]